MTNINTSSLSALRAAARTHGLWLSINCECTETDLVSLELSTIDADRDWRRNIEDRTALRWGAFLESCTPAKREWLTATFSFGKSKYHMDRRFLGGEFMEVRG